jgi:hypothetical protein
LKGIKYALSLNCSKCKLPKLTNFGEISWQLIMIQGTTFVIETFPNSNLNLN